MLYKTKKNYKLGNKIIKSLFNSNSIDTPRVLHGKHSKLSKSLKVKRTRTHGSARNGKNLQTRKHIIKGGSRGARGAHGDHVPHKTGKFVYVFTRPHTEITGFRVHNAKSKSRNNHTNHTNTALIKKTPKGYTRRFWPGQHTLELQTVFNKMHTKMNDINSEKFDATNLFHLKKKHQITNLHMYIILKQMMILILY